MTIHKRIYAIARRLSEVESSRPQPMVVDVSADWGLEDSTPGTHPSGFSMKRGGFERALPGKAIEQLTGDWSAERHETT
jgi:hypothetical protein